MNIRGQVYRDVTPCLPVNRFPIVESSAAPTKRRSLLTTRHGVTFQNTFIILCNDQPMQNQLTNYYTAPTCFGTVVSSSGNSQLVPCQVTQVCQMQLLVIQFKILHMFYVVQISMFKIFKTLKLSYLLYIYIYIYISVSKRFSALSDT
jgi:hypothetical protein